MQAQLTSSQVGGLSDPQDGAPWLGIVAARPHAARYRQLLPRPTPSLLRRRPRRFRQTRLHKTATADVEATTLVKQQRVPLTSSLTMTMTMTMTMTGARRTQA